MIQATTGRSSPVVHLLGLVPLFICLSLVTTCARGEDRVPAPAVATTSDVPRYRFEVGQELVYEQTGKQDLLEDEAEESENKTRRETESTWWVWPIRQNDDGSWRLLVRRHVKNSRIPAEGDPEVTFENDFLGYCDLHPDGSFAPNPTLGGSPLFKMHPEFLLIPLPTSAAALADGWEYTSPLEDAARFAFRLVGRDGDLVELAGPVVRPADVNYKLQDTWEVQFDQRRGLVAQLVYDANADWQASPWHTRTTIELTSVEQRDPQWVAQFDKEASQYIDVATQWWDRSRAAGHTHTKQACQQLVDQTRQLITKAQKTAQLDETRQLYDALLTLHDREAEWAVDDAATREEIYALPPADWETTDLDGTAYRVADYRGRVVVLDFWYRACGHCIDALPKIKRLAADYADRPVAVLGVNNDQHDEDARYVIDNFGLHYPVLRAGDIPKRYRVSGWPTFVVLDQTGRIADYTFGNSDGLYTHLKTAVDGLLAEPATEPAPRFRPTVSLAILLTVAVVVGLAALIRGRRSGSTT